MSIIKKTFLFFIFNIFILHQSFALNLDLKFHKETINDYCDFLYNKKDNLFSSDHWSVEEVDNIKEYFHLSSKIKIKIFPFIRGEKINGIRFTFNDGSWGLIRASSNKPSLVVVTESPTSDERKKKIFYFIDDLLQKTGKIGEYDQKI